MTDTFDRREPGNDAARRRAAWDRLHDDAARLEASGDATGALRALRAMMELEAKEEENAS